MTKKLQTQIEIFAKEVAVSITDAHGKQPECVEYFLSVLTDTCRDIVAENKKN
jgi:hypothetical protein